MNERINWPEPGTYVVAVSGGADSMVLLDILSASNRDYELIVAHYDHGLRPDSAADAEFVRRAAEEYHCICYVETGNLGVASEAEARSARHEFLERIRLGNSAAAIITAHHQDDLLETSLLNLARGTGRRGLAPMQDGAILRPLLGLTRDDLRSYATEHNIAWREDPTNADQTNPRNFLRHALLPLADDAWKVEYLAVIQRLGELNSQIEKELTESINVQPDGSIILHNKFVQHASISELKEIIFAAARRLNPDIEVDRKLLTELAEFAKTGKNGRWRPIRGTMRLEIDRRNITIRS